MNMSAKPPPRQLTYTLIVAPSQDSSGQCRATKPEVSVWLDPPQKYTDLSHTKLTHLRMAGLDFEGKVLVLIG